MTIFKIYIWFLYYRKQYIWMMYIHQQMSMDCQWKLLKNPIIFFWMYLESNSLVHTSYLFFKFVSILINKNIYFEGNQFIHSFWPEQNVLAYMCCYSETNNYVLRKNTFLWLLRKHIILRRKKQSPRSRINTMIKRSNCISQCYEVFHIVRGWD
jgi:hypothetical protein